MAKPDQGIFEVVERRWASAPDACVLVGDHPLNDVVGANVPGWRAVWIDREGDGAYSRTGRPPHEPDAVITSLQLGVRVSLARCWRADRQLGVSG